MDYLGIAVLIAVVVFSVHMVFKAGRTQGIEVGRMQILEENLKRSNGENELIRGIRELTGT